MLLALVTAGKGIALLPESLRRVAWPNVVFRPIVKPAPRADTYMAVPAGDESATVSNFVELAQQGAPRTPRKKAKASTR